MPRALRPTIELFRPDTWRAEVDAAIKEVTPRCVLEYLKSVPGEDMFADTMDYMRGAYADSGDYFDMSARENLIDRVIQKFAFFRSYHGCRPFSLESYFREGLLVLTRERLAKYAFELFEGSIPLDELLLRAQKANLEARLGNLFFTADSEDLVSECGHYLIYGSEALSCLWADDSGRGQFLFHDCQARHRAKGIPTVFECDVPTGWLPDSFRRELASTLVTHHFQLESNQPFPLEEWSRNWGHYISRDLPARYIRSHFHPSKIPDPLRQMISFDNQQTSCAWCKQAKQ